MPDIKLLMIEVDGGNDPVFVATNVEYIVIANFISGVKRGFDLGKVREHSRFNHLTPRLHRFIRCQVNRRKVSQCFIRDNSQGCYSISF